MRPNPDMRVFRLNVAVGHPGALLRQAKQYLWRAPTA